MHWIRPKLNAWLMLTLESAALTGKESDKRSSIEVTSKSLPNVRELFPGCPAEREVKIAEHACRKYSGRIGRSAAAKSFDEAAVLLAVAAHIRHRETNYDELLAKEWDRGDARAQVRSHVDEILQSWQQR